jgi:DNA polymerase-4
MKTQLPSEIANAGFKLFHERYTWPTKVRAVCIRAIDLVPKDDATQLNLFIDTERLMRRERLQDAIEECRRRFGKRSITYATLLGDLKMPDDGRDKVRMPGMMYV